MDMHHVPVARMTVTIVTQGPYLSRECRDLLDEARLHIPLRHFGVSSDHAIRR